MPSAITLSLPDWIDDEIAADLTYTDHAAQVALAIRLARRNTEERSGGPFGAAIFDGAGRIVAVGVNRVLAQGCSVAHAEIMAFIGAQARLGRARLNENGMRYTLATSAQPCCQCYGASFWAGIDEMLIGARSSDVMDLSGFDEGPLPLDWTGELERRGIRVHTDILRDEAREVFVLYAESGGQHY